MNKYNNKADTVTAGDYASDCGNVVDCSGCGCGGSKKDTKKSCGCHHK
ncbi:MAG: hypothetical protein ACRCTE_00495 [Cellulosilyticaceae bacterium]